MSGVLGGVCDKGFVGVGVIFGTVSVGDEDEVGVFFVGKGGFGWG
nr:hypothetical protein [Salmonella enterica]